jgi:hypothetical protein
LRGEGGGPEVHPVGQATIQDIVNNFEAGYLDGEPWTPRRLGETVAFSGLVNTSTFYNNQYSPMCVVQYPMPVGTASIVADIFEPWIREADIDGFNIACEFAFCEY